MVLPGMICTSTGYTLVFTLMYSSSGLSTTMGDSGVGICISMLGSSVFSPRR